MKLEDQAIDHPTATSTVAPYEASRLNALQHGNLSKFAVLPWENPGEYQTLLNALVSEHKPSGPTEEHLVEELAGVLWRKRRLRMAEASTFHRGLHAATASHRNTAQIAMTTAPSAKHAPKVEHAIQSGADDVASDLSDLELDQRQTDTALAILKAAGANAYDEALAILRDDTREAWVNQLTWEPGDYLDGAEPYQPSAEHLARYLTDEILTWYDEERSRLQAMPAVRAQALGDALDPDKLISLGRYEVHLDRKFERTLSTLLRLQELRRGRAQPPTA